MTAPAVSPSLFQAIADRFGAAEGLHITHASTASGDATGWGLTLTQKDGKRIHLQGECFPQAGDQITQKYVTLHEQLGEAPLGVPRPLAYFPEEKTFVRYRFPGMSLVTLAIEGNRHLGDAVERAGAWLARCQQLPVTLLDPATVHDEQLWTLIRRCVLLANLPDALPGAQRAVERVLDRLQQETVEPMSLVHGRYVWQQLYWTEHGFAAVDLAHVTGGDPAMDAGTFLADLDGWCLLSPNVHDKSHLMRRFWHGYGRPELMERAHTWRALALLEASERHLAKNDELATHLATLAGQVLRKGDAL